MTVINSVFEIRFEKAGAKFHSFHFTFQLLYSKLLINILKKKMFYQILFLLIVLYTLHVLFLMNTSKSRTFNKNTNGIQIYLKSTNHFVYLFIIFIYLKVYIFNP